MLFRSGKTVVSEVRDGLARTRGAASAALPADAMAPTVITLEWGDPPFLGGHWVPELVEHVGATHLLSSAGQPSRRSTWGEIAAADPDVIIFCPCGYDLHQATLEATALAETPTVASLRAVRTGRFFAVDANRLLSRCTTAVVEAAAVISQLVLPVDDERMRQIPTGARRIEVTTPVSCGVAE